ncbi:MAG: choice-of-anchor Q domain-containing protein, partial [bacterium]|nr:choice-of-anchor Q domain-containing protein [bacterium]
MRKALLLTAFPMLCLGPYTHAATWYVDASVVSSGDGTSWETPFKTIQEGIDATSEGDAVIVGPGTYPESIQFKGTNILLTSTNPLDPDTVGQTLIHESGPGAAVTFDGTEHEGCVLRGFAIRDGYWRSGGAIDGNETLATIADNLITNNSASSEGGAIVGCHGVIRNNVISGNWGYYAGGALAYCDGLIENNIITGNCVGPGGPPSQSLSAGSGEHPTDVPTEVRPGAGLYRCDGVIRNNVIVGNNARGFNGGIFMIEGWGGGLAGCNGVIEGNVIRDNYADMGDGGGLYSCNGVIRNNTIVSNRADNGGGLSACDGIIRSCIVFGNTAPFAGAQVHASSDPTYSCIQDWTGGGEGNVNLDPRFVDAENGNFRLRVDSPCIDAGFNSPDLAEFDIAGMHRIMFGGKSLTVDMGAYEFYIN